MTGYFYSLLPGVTRAIHFWDIIPVVMDKTDDDKWLHIAMRLYDAAWGLGTPLLQLNRRLKDGYTERKTGTGLPKADIWIQAASGGEAYLAWTLAKHLKPAGPVRILVTTNTRQGLEIIGKAKTGLAASNPDLTLLSGWFPFDRPSTMAQAVSRVAPRLAVLLESELWPGFVSALKRKKCSVVIVNGRMTEKSMSGYLKFPETCKRLRPDRVLAMSAEDRARFRKVFGDKGVSIMSNMKFDRLEITPPELVSNAPLVPDRRNGGTSDLARLDGRFLVLGSIREEEEDPVARIIKKVHAMRPDVVTGLFPRHLSRVPHWEKTIRGLGLRCRMRSDPDARVRAGDVVLWDVFGELSMAYGMADAVFVGGSLAPLGGQNFLEPLVHGIPPVIGPHYGNFAWVGEAIFHKKLVIKAANGDAVTDHLIRQLDNPAPRGEISAKARQFITSRQGGTHTACEVIETFLNEAV